MPVPLIAAGVGAAASIAGGIIGSNSQKKAAQKASDTSLAVADKNNALAREIYTQNTGNMQPFMQSGQRAMGVLNGLLYGDTPQAAQQPAQQATQPALGRPGAPVLPGSNRPAYPRALRAYDVTGGGALPVQLAPPQTMTVQPTAQPTAQPTGGTAPSAWDQFRNSTNYQFRLNEGLDALNHGYAARGLLQSGAAMRGINDYAQNFASNELGNYMGLLQGQQAQGLGAASALAGVGQNYAGMVTANNNSAGSAAANALLAQGQANANLWGNIAQGVGGLAGAVSSYGWGKK